MLARIAALRSEPPWSGYDDMEAEEVKSALKKRDGDRARAVLDYERQHKARTTIIEFAERMRDAAAASGATTSRGNGADKSGSRAPAPAIDVVRVELRLKELRAQVLQRPLPRSRPGEPDTGQESIQFLEVTARHRYAGEQPLEVAFERGGQVA